MDITNCRSMELLRSMGLADDLRKQGVSQDISFDVLFSSGLGEKGEKIARWNLPSPNIWREMIKGKNDGTMPREPYQRCSQAVFEAWLKPFIDAHPSVESHFGLKFESLEEDDEGVTSHLVDVTTGQIHVVKSTYVVGCDGAGSRVRRSIGIDLTGGPVPNKMYLVHFKSRDLTRLHRQGQFWHIFFATGAILISQNEVDAWTAHLPMPLEENTESINPYEIVSQVLGGIEGQFNINIDEILLHNTWRPTLAVANSYRTEKGRVFLAGDSAHQNVPIGGYGMNTGLGDAFDIAWKLSAVLNGYGGEDLLASYEIERRPVGLRNVERSRVHASVHEGWARIAAERGQDVLLSDTDESRKVKQDIANFVNTNDGENKDHGIEMGYSFPDSPVVVTEVRTAQEKEPEWSPRHYMPSTKPGSRAPHVYLQDGKTSILDLYGMDYTVVDFTLDGEISKVFEDTAQKLSVPIQRVHLPDEPHVASIWQKSVVLVRPDGFVAWRSDDRPGQVSVTAQLAEDIISRTVGRHNVRCRQ
ncbi:hypothetical protein MW887_000884 [Aspergillus wentii]|nr:hypothetical protein MW887_000884 [Aspergillus wentii]